MIAHSCVIQFHAWVSYLIWERRSVDGMKNCEWFPNESPDDAGRGQSIRPGSGLKVSILILRKEYQVILSCYRYAQHVPEHLYVLEGEYLNTDKIASSVQMRFMVHCRRAITVIFLFLLLSVLSFFDLPKADRREKCDGDVISDGIMVWVLWGVCGSRRKNSETPEAWLSAGR